MGMLAYQDSVKLLKHNGFTLASSVLAKNQAEAVCAAQKIGFPVAVKLISPNVVHKTDKKAVYVNIAGVLQLKRVIRTLKKIDRDYEGILIQKMYSGIELFAGIHPDPVFGSVVGFGLGGVLVEVNKDVHFKVAPLTQKDAAHLLAQSKVYHLVSGYRGQHLVAVLEVIRFLLRLSRLAQTYPNISLDCNPVFIHNKKLIIADWRVLDA